MHVLALVVVGGLLQRCGWDSLVNEIVKEDAAYAHRVLGEGVRLCW